MAENYKSRRRAAVEELGRLPRLTFDDLPPGRFDQLRAADRDTRLLARFQFGLIARGAPSDCPLKTLNYEPESSPQHATELGRRARIYAELPTNPRGFGSPTAAPTAADASAPCRAAPNHPEWRCPSRAGDPTVAARLMRGRLPRV